MSKLKIRTQFDPSEDPGIDFRKLNKKTGEYEFDPGMTKQADKDACDINLILARYEHTGYLPELRQIDARYGDFSDVGTFQEALDVVLKAEEQFSALPAKVRDRFGNDPAKMLEFCGDEKNRKEMIELGLIDAPPPPSPGTVPSEGGGT